MAEDFIELNLEDVFWADGHGDNLVAGPLGKDRQAPVTWHPSELAALGDEPAQRVGSARHEAGEGGGGDARGDALGAASLDLGRVLGGSMCCGEGKRSAGAGLCGLALADHVHEHGVGHALNAGAEGRGCRSALLDLGAHAVTPVWCLPAAPRAR